MMMIGLESKFQAKLINDKSTCLTVISVKATKLKSK